MQPVYPDPPPCGLLLDLGRAQHPQGVNVVRSPRRREPLPPTELSVCVSARLGARSCLGKQGESCWRSSPGPAGPPAGWWCGRSGDSCWEQFQLVTQLLFEVCCPRRTALIAGLWSRSQFPQAPMRQPSKERAGQLVGHCNNCA